MKYPAPEKLEIIRLVEGSHLGVKRTLAKIGVSRTAFYRWYDLHVRFGEQEIEDRRAGAAERRPPLQSAIEPMGDIDIDIFERKRRKRTLVRRTVPEGAGS